MEFQIRTNNIEESNNFLKKLWAELEERFNKCSWQYIPHKVGYNTTIEFGFMDIGLATAFKVSIKYSTRGSIDRLFIIPLHEELIDLQVEKEISNCVAISLSNDRDKLILGVEVILRSYNKIAPYRGTNFTISPVNSSGKSKLKFLVNDYNAKQAHHIILEKMDNLINLLAVDTNFIFTHRIVYDNSPVYKEMELEQENLYYNNSLEPELENKLVKIDGEQYITLSKSICDYLDIFLEKDFNDYNKNENDMLFFSSCNHFHSALKMYDSYLYDNTIGNSLYGNSFEEIALTLYMSSLEVISSNKGDNIRCENCNQVIYSIKRKVVNMVNERFPNGAISSLVGNYYDMRSKYLHAGVGLMEMHSTGHSIPQLSLIDKTGCKRNFNNIDFNSLNFVIRTILTEQLQLISQS